MRCQVILTVVAIFANNLQQSKPSEIYEEPDRRGNAPQRSSQNMNIYSFARGETPQPNFEVRPARKLADRPVFSRWYVLDVFVLGTLTSY